MKKIILHDYRRCPFCIRVRILLFLKKIDYEKIHEPLRIWTPWMRKVSKEKKFKPSVPILRFFQGFWFFKKEKIIRESNQINLFLDENFGKKEFTPEKNSDEYKKMIEWWSWCEEFKKNIDLFKYGDDFNFDKEKTSFIKKL